jgi:hypothetical protein
LPPSHKPIPIEVQEEFSATSEGNHTLAKRIFPSYSMEKEIDYSRIAELVGVGLAGICILGMIIY